MPQQTNDRKSMVVLVFTVGDHAITW